MSTVVKMDNYSVVVEEENSSIKDGSAKITVIIVGSSQDKQRWLRKVDNKNMKCEVALIG